MDINELRGLLEPSAQDKQDALSMGLLNLGSGLLANSTGHYGQFAPAMGRGLQAGMQGYQGGLQQARESRFNDLNLRMKLAEMQKRQAQEQKTQEVLGTLTPEQQRIYALGGGDALAKSMLPPEPEKTPWYVQKDAAGRPIGINPLYAEFEKAKARSSAPATSYYQPVQTAQGVMAFNARTGRMEPVQVNGQTVIGAQADPSLQGSIASAKEFGKTTAEDKAKGIVDAPRVIANAEEALRQADELVKHPGFKQAVGASSILGVQKIPGTDAKDFMNRLDQIRGGAFLEAFNSLKGGGQITEVEGKKATDAIARMDNATSEAEFKNAVRDYQNVIRNGMNRAKIRSGGNLPAQSAPQAPGGAKFLGFE